LAEAVRAWRGEVIEAQRRLSELQRVPAINFVPHLPFLVRLRARGSAVLIIWLPVRWPK
jgi:hypothetical protein